MDATSQAMRLHFSNKKHLDGERIARSTSLFSSTAFQHPSSSSPPLHVRLLLSRVSFSPFFLPLSRDVILISSRVLSGRSSVSVFIAWRNRRVPGKLLSRVETRDRTREPFLPTTSRGAGGGLVYTHCREEARGAGIPAKSLNRCFYRLFFLEERNYCSCASLRPASRRACGFTAATSYFIVLFNCLAS